MRETVQTLPRPGASRETETETERNTERETQRERKREREREGGRGKKKKKKQQNAVPVVSKNRHWAGTEIPRGVVRGRLYLTL